MTMDLHKALKQFFNYDSFLDHQLHVVEEMASGRDICVVMPTGAGKSLCYQLPLLASDGYGLIVSPLISLMKDQVDSLLEKSLPAACLNTSIDYDEQRTILARTAAGMIKLLYVAPERFQTAMFRNFITENPPRALIVDEAHCISQWGHDFRPSYLRLGEIVEELKIPQVCAFTATATEKVREDIVIQLHRPFMEKIVAGFKRPNLAFSVVQCSGNEEKLSVLRKLLENRTGAAIIYASTRKNVEMLRNEFGCIAYHAGMKDQERNEAQDRFMTEKTPVLAATNAFGMGIDRSDVRLVIHYNMPGSIEAYYQEAGRAGRDAEYARCVLLFSYADKFVQEFLIDMNNPSGTQLAALWTILRSESKRRQSEQIDLTLEEFATKLPEFKSSQLVGSALSILEQKGYVARVYNSGDKMTFRVIQPLKGLLEEHENQKTLRSIFVYRFIRYAGGNSAVMCSWDLRDLSAATGLSVAQIKRVITHLEGTVFECAEQFRGRSTLLLRGNEETLCDIDPTELEYKKNLELARLEDMISYAQTSECRQAYLISYFGEEVKNWKCANCDHCDRSEASRRVLSSSERQAVWEILDCVRYYNGRMGRGRLCQILCGARNADLVRMGYDSHPHFALLEKFPQTYVQTFFKVLESEGYLERDMQGEYPCLSVTDQALEFLKSPAELSLDLPPEEEGYADSSSARRKEHRSRTGRMRTGRIRLENIFDNDPVDAESSSLLEQLKLLRKQFADRRNCEPYKIFPDRVLRELAKKRPMCLEDAKEIKGIGDGKKLYIFVPEFIRVIQAWCNGTDHPC